MKPIQIIFYPMVLLALIGLVVSQANAQANHDPAVQQAAYTIDWYTIDGGGALNGNGGSYSLSGAIGQPDAGASGGGSYTLVGGFWGGAVIASYSVYLPLILR
jgi:hypothetical protein